MVSHWPVSSDAAVSLATGAIEAIASEPDIGRAEALRRSIFVLIARGGANAQPGIWAPFVLVGNTSM
jgi:CHAT domain-containing protein